MSWSSLTGGLGAGGNSQLFLKCLVHIAKRLLRYPALFELEIQGGVARKALLISRQPIALEGDRLLVGEARAKFPSRGNQHGGMMIRIGQQPIVEQDAVGATARLEVQKVFP